MQVLVEELRLSLADLRGASTRGPGAVSAVSDCAERLLARLSQTDASLADGHPDGAEIGLRERFALVCDQLTQLQQSRAWAAAEAATMIRTLEDQLAEARLARDSALASSVAEEPRVLRLEREGLWAEIEALRNQIIDLSGARDHAERQLLEVYASTSWRWSWPIRAFRASFNRFRKKA